MKRKTAKEILAESFRELAESKPVDKITVPNIIENCGYSKTTFYRLFKDKYDLMAWDYAQRLQAIVGQTEKEDVPRVYPGHGFLRIRTDQGRPDY